MRVVLIWIGCIILTTLRSTAQQSTSLQTAAFGMPESASSGKNSIASVDYNPALLSTSNSFQLLIASERRFLLPELGYYLVAVAKRIPHASVFASAAYSGTAEYRTSELSIGMAKPLGSIVRLSLKFHYYTESAKGYPPFAIVSFSLGSLFKVSEKFSVGIVGLKPRSFSFDKKNQKAIASAYGLTIGYNVSTKFYIGSTIGKELNQPIAVRVGFRYNIADKVLIRSGIGSDIGNIYFGIGYCLKDFNLLFNFDYHQQLGITPGLMLAVERVRSDEE